MSEYDAEFCSTLLVSLCIILMTAQCRCDSRGILVSFYWQSAIQVSYAIVRELILYNLYIFVWKQHFGGPSLNNVTFKTLML